MGNNTISIEQQFQAHINIEKTNLSRTMCLLGAFLYLLFAIVDYFALSAPLIHIIYVRGIIIVILLSVFAYSHYESFIKQYDLLFLAVYVLAAAGIEVMIYLAAPSDHASKVYLAGLLLVIMTMFTWSYLKISSSLLASTIIISSYMFLDLYKGLLISDLVINISFLISATAIGFISQVNRDRYLKENFILQLSLKKAVAEKTVEANQDGLTGLVNRRHVKILLEELLQKLSTKKNKTLVIIFIDINDFKQINDTHGHSVGDKVLNIIARRLELAVKKNDIVARLGGDEYLIGLKVEKNNFTKIQGIAKKFSKRVSDPMRIDGLKLNISASIGVAIYPNHGETINELIDAADKKMYLMKSDKFKNKIAKKDTHSDFLYNRLKIVK